MTQLSGHERHRRKVLIGMEQLPEGLVAMLDKIIKERKRKQGACIINVRSLLKKALRNLSVIGAKGDKQALENFTDQNIRAAMYNVTALRLEKHGGVLWGTSTRSNRDHKGPSTRVYKFESD